MKTYKGKRQDRSLPETNGKHLVTVEEDGNVYPLKHIVKHSPDGFEWGYGGSGPAELSRCILIDYLIGLENSGQLTGAIITADGFYQDFKFEVVAGWKNNEWQITSDEINEWIKKRVQKDTHELLTK